MTRLLLIMMLCMGVAVSSVVTAQDTTIKQTETHSVFKGLFLSIWGKLKSLNPTQKQSAKSTKVYTAGIRGAESTDTLLKPYWKDDLTQDKKFQAELLQFSQAQSKLDNGDLENATKAFDKFISSYQQSSLRPNALFAKSIALAGSGKNNQSIVLMQQFLDENPNHPLAGDARQVINALSV